MTFFSSFDSIASLPEGRDLLVAEVFIACLKSVKISNPCLKSTFEIRKSDFQLVVCCFSGCRTAAPSSGERSDCRGAPRSSRCVKLGSFEDGFFLQTGFSFNVFCLFSKNLYFFSKLRFFFGTSGASEMNYQILSMFLILILIRSTAVLCFWLKDQPLPKLS